MKRFKRIFTVLSAMALIIGMGATQAKAEKVITTNIDNAEMRGSDFYYDALAAGIVDGVYGVKVTIVVADESAGFGGGLIINSDAGWNSKEWGNSDAGKPISAEPTGNAGEYTLTRLDSEAVYASGVTYAEVAIQSWWGGDFEVTKLELLDASGNVLTATAEDSSTTEEVTEEETTEEETTEEDSTTTEETAEVEESPETGDNSNLVIVYSILGLAFVAFVGNLFYNKKKSFQ